MQEVKWGMIGCGNVTEKKAGAPAINKVPHSKLVAVMARKADKAKDYAERHGVARWYTDVDALINDPEVNAVYIATPPNVHLAYAAKAIKAGKAVYIEKPMARDFAECEAINKLAAEAGVPVFVAYYRRTLPYFVKLKELIDSGVIGDIRLINITLHWQPYGEETGEDPQPRWRVFPEISGGGHFHDLASHQFDWLEYVFGKIKYAKGISRNQAGLYPADDVVVANFEFENGILGNGSWCYTVNKEQRIDRTQLIGSKGKIIFSFFESSFITIETAGGITEYEVPYPPHVQQPLLETIVSELRGEGTCPSTGETGARSSLVMDRIVAKQG
ncbi:MAG: Gfo/Idh/MocA family oxidoreductase [Chitinophagaceae bacterium]|nr:Gfo/Idh/MocA family oxidoreductase [Chitinophagaceae bacterium]MCW5929731.1 Gfo/Idh/MocA family oxidoreductase [Chitinophagaceae bacterium]